MIRGLFQRNKQDSPRQMETDAGKLGIQAEGILQKASSNDNSWHKPFRDTVDKMIDVIQGLKDLQSKRGIDNSTTITRIAGKIRELWDVGDEKGCAKPMIDADLAQKLAPLGKPPQSL